MEAIAERQIAALAPSWRVRLKRTTPEQERARIATCTECPSAVDTLGLCLECGCNFMQGAKFAGWVCKLGKF